VSISTVSRYLRGTSAVSNEVEDRIKNAAAALGVPLSRHSKATVVAFLLSNRARLHPFHSRVLDGAEEYCSSRGFHMLFVPFHYEFTASWRELRLPELLDRRDSVGGIIAAGSNSQSLLDAFVHKKVPFVVLGNNVLGEWSKDACNVIWFDDVSGARELTNYLQSLGHRDIWYVGNPRMPWFARRYEGYCQAMESAALTSRISSLDSEDEQQLGYLATKTILSKGDPVTAIFAGGDLTAHGVYEAIREHGLRIPDDISVAGFDDTQAAMLHPSLTSVRVFADQVGRQLAELLMNQIAHSDSPPHSQVIPTQIVKRDSCGPVPAAKNVGPISSDGERQTNSK
jgi:LacI family transcriptional regulator, galactose operon repressor